MFLGPLEQSKPWDTNGIDGVHRLKAVLSDERSARWLEGKTVVKVIVVPKKIVNVVVK
jgi:leucyl-tRNA synthetase